MRAFGFLVLVSCLLESSLGATTTKPCICTSKWTAHHHYTGTSTITGSASCTARGLKPTCPTTSSTKATTTPKLTSTTKASSTAKTSSSTKVSSMIKTSTSTKTSTTTKASTTAKASTLLTSTKPSTTTKTITSSCTPHPTGTGKRGLAYNDAALTKPFALCGQSSKVSWAYNWYSSPYSPNTPSSGFNPALKFTPMLWSTASDLTSIWDANVAQSISSYAADAVLAFNEPDGCGGGGSCMSVASAVSGYKTWVSPLRSKYPSLKLGAPAVTNGGSPMGLTYLGQFLGNCTGCNIDFIPIHWYGDAGDVTGFKNYVTGAYSAIKSKYPLWITEFGCTSGTSAQIMSFSESVLPWLDGLSYVSRYAWFMDASGYLINSTAGGLSQTGVIYNTN